MTDWTDALTDQDLLDVLGPSWDAMTPRARWAYGIAEPTDAGWKQHQAQQRKARKAAKSSAKQIANAQALADRYPV